MRALLGCLLVLSLAVSPAMAGTGSSDSNTTPASSTSGTSTTAAQPAASAAPAATTAAKPAASSMESELEELRDQMDSQARQIQEQNDQLKAEQQKMKELEEKLKAANSTAAAPSSPALNLSTGSSSNLTLASAAISPSIPSSSSAALPKAAAAEPQATAPNPLSFKIGGADFTPGGFIDVMNVFRTTDDGGSIGSSFGGVLYPNVVGNYPLVGSTEDRFSLQNSRITLRVDANVAGGKGVGYLEADFLGNAAGTIHVTSNSDTLRMRVYFFDWTKGKFEFLGGQDWGMLTSNRTGIGFMPGDVFFSSDVDTNYQLGLVWQRTSQVRFIYHATKTLAAGISLENPQQFVGSSLEVYPTFNPSNVNFLNQLDTNGNATGGGVNTPNVVPDIVAKIAFDPMMGKKHEHIEVAGIARTFRSITYTAAVGVTPPASVSSKTEGGGIALNSNWEIFKNFHIIENAFWSDGDGRDIIGLVPDVVVRPLNAATPGAYTLSPVHSGSFIGGFEYQVTPKTLFYGYTSGVYASHNYVIVPPVSFTGTLSCFTAGATCIGYGAPNTSQSVSEAANRYMQEHTLGINETLWRNPQFGAVNFMAQASYVERQPWYVAPGFAASAHLFMAYVDLRYTLP